MSETVEPDNNGKGLGETSSRNNETTDRRQDEPKGRKIKMLRNNTWIKQRNKPFTRITFEKKFGQKKGLNAQVKTNGWTLDKRRIIEQRKQQSIVSQHIDSMALPVPMPSLNSLLPSGMLNTSMKCGMAHYGLVTIVGQTGVDSSQPEGIYVLSKQSVGSLQLLTGINRSFQWMLPELNQSEDEEIDVVTVDNENNDDEPLQITKKNEDVAMYNDDKGEKSLQILEYDNDDDNDMYDYEEGEGPLQIVESEDDADDIQT